MIKKIKIADWNDLKEIWNKLKMRSFLHVDRDREENVCNLYVCSLLQNF
jgi:hypothetical protein